MADVKTDQEPSIEEILESIRQIISEDDAPAAEPEKTLEAAPQPKAEAFSFEPEPEVAVPPSMPLQQPAAPFADEGILDLTEKVVEDEGVHLDLHHNPLPKKVRAKSSEGGEDMLISSSTADAAAEAMARLLEGNVAVERDVPGRVGNVTLEDMARELMRPLIKTWLDQNLPTIVEKMVKKEIEKVSHRAFGG